MLSDRIVDLDIHIDSYDIDRHRKHDPFWGK